MIGVDSREFIEKMDKDCSDDEMQKIISDICQKLYRAKELLYLVLYIQYLLLLNYKLT